VTSGKWPVVIIVLAGWFGYYSSASQAAEPKVRVKIFSGRSEVIFVPHGDCQIETESAAHPISLKSELTYTLRYSQKDGMILVGSKDGSQNLPPKVLIQNKSERSSILIKKVQMEGGGETWARETIRVGSQFDR